MEGEGKIIDEKLQEAEITSRKIKAHTTKRIIKKNIDTAKLNWLRLI